MIILKISRENRNSYAFVSFVDKYSEDTKTTLLITLEHQQHDETKQKSILETKWYSCTVVAYRLENDDEVVCCRISYGLT